MVFWGGGVGNRFVCLGEDEGVKDIELNFYHAPFRSAGRCDAVTSTLPRAERPRGGARQAWKAAADVNDIQPWVSVSSVMGVIYNMTICL